MTALAAQAASETGAARKWALKWENGTRVNVVIAGDVITCSPKGEPVYAIPIAEVFAIEYETARKRYSEPFDSVMKDAAETVGAIGNPAAGLLLAGPVFVAVIPDLIVRPFKATRHFVTIRWQSSGLEDSTRLRVGKGEYAAFLRHLETATGRP